MIRPVLLVLLVGFVLAGEAVAPLQRSIYGDFPVGTWWDYTDAWPRPDGGGREIRLLSIVSRNQADGGIAMCNWQRAGETWEVRGHRAGASPSDVVTRTDWLPRNDGQRIIADRQGIVTKDPDPRWQRIEAVPEHLKLAGRDLVTQRHTWRMTCTDGAWKELTLWHADGIPDCRQGVRYGRHDLDILLPADAVQARFRMGKGKATTWTTLGGVTAFGVTEAVPGVPAAACVVWRDRDAGPEGVQFSERVLWPGVPGGIVREDRTAETGGAVARRYRLLGCGISAGATPPPSGRIAAGVWTGSAVGDWVRLLTTDAGGAVTADETRRVLGVDRMGSPHLAVIDHLHGDRADEEIVHQLAPILGPGRLHKQVEQVERRIPFGNRAEEAVQLCTYRLTDEWNRPGDLLLGEIATWKLPWRSFGGGTGGDNLLGPTVVLAVSEYNGGSYERRVLILDEAVAVGDRHIACVHETEVYRAGRIERRSEILTSTAVPGGIVQVDITGMDWQGKAYKTHTVAVGFGRADAL